MGHAGVGRKTAKIDNGRVSVGDKVLFLEDYPYAPHGHHFRTGDTHEVRRIWQDGSIVTLTLRVPTGEEIDVWTCYARLSKA